MSSTVYLIPTVLSEGEINCLPGYILDAVKNCTVFFVENERTTRRYLKLLWKEMIIDDYEWFNMKDVNDEVASAFRQKIKEGKNIGIISEAGCPGIADPGQQFQFVGYLPIDSAERIKAIKTLESESRQKNCTQIFIETPYRNNQLLETLTKTVQPQTKICVAADLTAPTEMVQTKTAQQWKTAMPQIHKRPTIFLVYSGN